MILKLWVLKLDLASPRFSPTIPVFVNHLQTLILKTEANFNSILYVFGTLLITETETPLRPWFHIERLKTVAFVPNVLNGHVKKNSIFKAKLVVH